MLACMTLGRFIEERSIYLFSKDISDLISILDVLDLLNLYCLLLGAKIEFNFLVLK